MTSVEVINEALSQWPQPRAQGSRVIVPTHCLFGSGGIINVVVEGGRDTFTCHDGGAAIDEFEACGGNIPNAAKVLRSHFRKIGFKVDDGGQISAPAVGSDALAASIALVANATREAADFLLDRWRPVFKRDFKDMVRQLLESEFSAQRLARGLTYVGDSNKRHKFDFVVRLAQDRSLLLDAVVPEATAINSATVKHLDIKAKGDPHLVQRILYDDRHEWKAADLNVLRLGATPVPFSHAKEVLEQIAA